MTGVDLQTKRTRLSGACNQPFEFHFPPPLIVESLGKGARVELDELAAGARGGFDLSRICRDKQADFDPGVVHPLAGFPQRMNDAGIEVSLFIAADPAQIE